MLPDKYPEHEFKFINRGVSGDKVKDLVCRWDIDCISLKGKTLCVTYSIINIQKKTIELKKTLV